MAFAVHAAGHERIVADIAEAFSQRDDGGWVKS